MPVSALELVLSSIARALSLTASNDANASLTAAGATATVLAVVVTISLVYAGIVLERIHGMRESAIDLVNRVLRSHLGYETYSSSKKYNPRDAQQRADLVEAFWRTTAGQDSSWANNELERNWLPVRGASDAERGQALLEMASTLINNYPLRRPPILQEDDLRKWCKVANQYVHDLQATIPGRNPRAARYFVAEKELWSRIFDHLNLLDEKVREIKAIVDKMDSYAYRLPARKVVLAAAGVTSLAFVCGVVLPLVATVPRWVWGYIPAALFAVGVFCGLVALVVKYNERPDIDELPYKSMIGTASRNNKDPS